MGGTFALFPIPAEALATALTGLLAVGAAWHIGIRQTAIQRRQSQIAENDLKVQLLEKRAACIAKMREISGAWFTNARLSPEEWIEFRNLLWEVQLMYPNSLTKNIKEAVDNTFWANIHYRRATESHKLGKDDKANEHHEKAFAAEDKVMELMPSLLDKLVESTRIDAWQ